MWDDAVWERLCMIRQIVRKVCMIRDEDYIGIAECLV